MAGEASNLWSIFGMPAHDYPWLSCLSIIRDYLANVKSASARLLSGDLPNILSLRMADEAARQVAPSRRKISRFFQTCRWLCRIFRWAELSCFKKDNFWNILGNDPPTNNREGGTFDQGEERATL